LRSVNGLSVFWLTPDLTDFEEELEEVAESVFVRGAAIKVPLESRQDQPIAEGLLRRLAEAQ
jgi:hypothetical protein